MSERSIKYTIKSVTMTLIMNECVRLMDELPIGIKNVFILTDTETDMKNKFLSPNFYRKILIDRNVQKINNQILQSVSNRKNIGKI